MLSIKLKFNKFIIDHFFSYYISFGVSRRYSFFTGVDKMSCIMVYKLKILEGVSVFT